MNSFPGHIYNNTIPGCAEPAEDSSQAGSSSDSEMERDQALDRAQKGARPLQPRKRKDNDGASARVSPVKRPRHEGTTGAEARGAMRPPITTSISAPGSFSCILSLKL